MARIRTIKPEFATDEKLAKVSRDARLTFVLCITQSDDDGLLPGNHRQLLASLYPLDETVNYAKLAGWIEELVELGRLRWRQTVDGSPILEIVNWSMHQKVDHKGKSLILPLLRPMSEDDAKVSRDSREGLATVSRSDLGPRTRDQGPLVPSGDGTRGGDAYPKDFEAAWAIYPQRTGGNSKKDAYAAWRARRKSGVAADALRQGVERYAAFCAAEGKVGSRFVMMAASFFGPGEHYTEPWTIVTEPVRDEKPRVLAATEMLLP